jgi:uncharacterized repeat protein (TIGR01451 family)
MTLVVSANLPGQRGAIDQQQQRDRNRDHDRGQQQSHTLVASGATISKAQSVAPPPDANGNTGSTITYTLVVSNPANVVPATNVVVTDTIPRRFLSRRVVLAFLARSPPGRHGYI